MVGLQGLHWSLFFFEKMKMTRIRTNNENGISDFIDFVTYECKKNDGGLVLQLIDGIFDLASPDHLEWVDKLPLFPIRHITKEDASALGYDELSDWSHDDDELIYSEMGVLFNLGNTRKGMFKF